MYTLLNGPVALVCLRVCVRVLTMPLRLRIKTLRVFGAYSSGVERYVDIVEVRGSRPRTPTRKNQNYL